MDELEKYSGDTLIENKELMDSISKYTTSPFEVDTPKEKVKKKPVNKEGTKFYDYVKGSYMDKEFKKYSPLYEYTYVNVEDVLTLGYIRATVILKNKITGNTEVGTGAARIQVSREAKKNGTFTFLDVIDYDKNLKSALEQARKNAQRQFGIASDVYRRREFEPSPEESDRYIELINACPPHLKGTFKEEWSELGDGFEEILDKWERKINKYKDSNKKKEEDSGVKKRNKDDNKTNGGSIL